MERPGARELTCVCMVEGDMQTRRHVRLREKGLAGRPLVSREGKKLEQAMYAGLGASCLAWPAYWLTLGLGSCCCWAAPARPPGLRSIWTWLILLLGLENR